MRRHVTFPCHDDILVGSLDDAAGTTGLLIVSGGNEIRAGAHRGMAMLAGRLATIGIPVFRYDRRGTGDSSGENTGFSGARDDLVAAATAFRRHAPHVRAIIGFGNCDAATTLALCGKDAGLNALILANPWVVEPKGDIPPPAAIRAHYRARLRDPGEWLRVARHGFSVTKLVRGLLSIAAPRRTDDLANRTLAAIAAWGDAVTIVLASGDATAIAYADAARGKVSPETIRIDTTSHSFARPGDAAALEDAIRAAVAKMESAAR